MPWNIPVYHSSLDRQNLECLFQSTSFHLSHHDGCGIPRDVVTDYGSGKFLFYKHLLLYINYQKSPITYVLKTITLFPAA